jgi:hypothetical protein
MMIKPEVDRSLLVGFCGGSYGICVCGCIGKRFEALFSFFMFGLVCDLDCYL